MKQWDIVVNGTAHEIIFEGCKITGKAKIRIDATEGIYSPVIVKSIGLFYRLDVDDSEIILKLDLNNNPVGLIQDGIYLESGLPVEEQVIAAFREPLHTLSPTAKNDKAGMGSFLSFVVLTYVNFILIFVNAPLSFPFSAMVPQLVLGIAYSVYDETSSMFMMVAGVIFSLIFASVYLVLYLLARKRTWPVIVALILVVIDSLVIVYFVIDDFSSYIIDIAFHAWVIWSLVNLIRARKKHAEA